MKQYFFILCTIHALLMPTVFAKQPLIEDSKQTVQHVNEANTYYFNADWKHVTAPVDNGFYRKILKVTPKMSL